MLKRSIVLLLVVALLFSFSAVVFAQAENNQAGVRILVDEDGDGTDEIHFLDAVNENAFKENPSQGEGNNHPTNPILVAGD